MNRDDEPFEDDDDLVPTPPAEQKFPVDETAAGQRLDQFLVSRLHDVSRARIQHLIQHGHVSIFGEQGRLRGAQSATKPSEKLRLGEIVLVSGETAPPPLRATPEPIPLDIVYEDAFLAVINKPAGMMVHAGSGATESARNRGTLVNALLHHMAKLSATGGPLRPGIVHRLDKQTSGLILVAKDDRTHARLAAMFQQHQVRKTYLALVHGAVQPDRGTLNAPISRDRQRRTRMTTRRTGGRTAISHYGVRQRYQSRYGRFTLLEVDIETGRTHQIRVHLSAIGHPVVGDTLYGAPRSIAPRLDAPATRVQKEAAQRDAIALDRNFLHATRLELTHPQSGEPLRLEAPLPADLERCLDQLTAPS